MSEVVSDCCGASVVEGRRQFFPLGGRNWSISEKIEVCERCEMPCDAEEVIEDEVPLEHSSI